MAIITMTHTIQHLRDIMGIGAAEVLTNIRKVVNKLTSIHGKDHFLGLFLQEKVLTRLGKDILIMPDFDHF